MKTKNLNVNHKVKCGGLGLNIGLNSRNLSEEMSPNIRTQNSAVFFLQNQRKAVGA